jgi:hypothetical protein
MPVFNVRDERVCNSPRPALMHPHDDTSMDLQSQHRNREVLQDKAGQVLGRFEFDTGVTREASGKIIGRGSNQLFRLLK